MQCKYANIYASPPCAGSSNPNWSWLLDSKVEVRSSYISPSKTLNLFHSQRRFIRKWKGHSGSTYHNLVINWKNRQPPPRELIRERPYFNIPSASQISNNNNRIITNGSPIEKENQLLLQDMDPHLVLVPFCDVTC